MGYLKYPQAVTAATVSDPGPSAGKLKPGDALDMVDGTPVANVEQFTAYLKKTKPGQVVTIDYRRKNEPAGVTQITLGTNKDRDYGFMGVAVLDAPWAPFVVDFNLANVGGPSAGLMFSLAVVDKLTTGDLAGSTFVAGTGTISIDGKVGPIGGIGHKMAAARSAGATVFLVPAKNCYEATSNNRVRFAFGEGRDPRQSGGRTARRDVRGTAAELLAQSNELAGRVCTVVTVQSCDRATQPSRERS